MGNLLRWRLQMRATCLFVRLWSNEFVIVVATMRFFSCVFGQQAQEGHKHYLNFKLEFKLEFKFKPIFGACHWGCS